MKPFQVQECGYIEHEGPSGNWTTLSRFYTLAEAQVRLKETPTNWSCLRIHCEPADVQAYIDGCGS